MAQDLMTPDAFLDQLSDLFASHKKVKDIGNRISNADHMLQAAAAADAVDAGAHLIAASLLHDIGHWLHNAHDDAADQGHDDCHEKIAADFLTPYFNAAVLTPIALHVSAKRYLCTVEPGYFEALSPGSVRTLELQGGLMNAKEVEDFEAEPGYQDALALRRWDEYGKELGRDVPGFDTYRAVLRSQMKG